MEPTIAHVTTNDMLSMRAYLCTSCANHVSHNLQNMASLRGAGAARVRLGPVPNGHAPDRVGPVAKSRVYSSLDNQPALSMKFMPNVLPATGCACGKKLLDRTLCRFHRLYSAEHTFRQAELCRNFHLALSARLSVRRVFRGRQQKMVTFRQNKQGFEAHGHIAWASLISNTWVVT